jgi:tetraprenyl-beta-curcumene synthase
MRMLQRACSSLRFVDFAARYWLLAFPHVRRAVRRCGGTAAAIRDPHLREAALTTLAQEQGNLEGAAAFAAYTSRRRRGPLVDALVAFQATFDYADTLAERANADPVANAHALHQALLASLSLEHRSRDYHAHSGSDDDGYIEGLVQTCRAACASLPSHAAVELPLRRGVQRMIGYQELVHADATGRTAALASWAGDETPTGSGLRWWETAAACASSLDAFALIAAAADPDLQAREVAAIERAYFPWVGALHVLLDSLVDRPHDLEVGHPSLVDHYRSPHDTAVRMEMIAHTAFASTAALAQPHRHRLLLAAMTGFYLAKPVARLPHAAEATERLTAVLGELAQPVLLVHRTRSRLGR